MLRQGWTVQFSSRVLPLPPSRTIKRFAQSREASILPLMTIKHLEALEDIGQRDVEASYPDSRNLSTLCQSRKAEVRANVVAADCKSLE